MIDREELNPHFKWLAGSEYYDQTVGEATLAIELCAADHGREHMRYGYAIMSASGVVEVLRLDRFVDLVREARAAGRDLCIESVADVTAPERDVTDPEWVSR